MKKEITLLTGKYVDMLLEDPSNNEGWEGLSFILEELEEIEEIYNQLEAIGENL